MRKKRNVKKLESTKTVDFSFSYVHCRCTLVVGATRFELAASASRTLSSFVQGHLPMSGKGQLSACKTLVFSAFQGLEGLGLMVGARR